jgi:hypothetical protein
MLECAAALFVRYPCILEYCDGAQWHAVWALVGSGRATGQIINLPNHEQAMAYVQAAIATLGQPSPGPATAPPPAPAPVASPTPQAGAPPAPTPAGQPIADGAASIAATFDKLFTRLENAIARIPHPS